MGSGGDRISIVTTVFPAYDFARQIADNCADIYMLIKPGSELHSYEPTPADIQLINNCDLFIYVGGESDSWIDSVLETIDNPAMKIVKMMDCVNNIEEEYAEGMQVHNGDEQMHGHSKEEHMHEYDEHIWTSPLNAVYISEVIKDILIKIDNINAENYQKNGDEYIAELMELHGDFIQLVNNSKRRLLIFGDRFPLLYFVKEYELDYYAAYPGCAAESEPNVQTLAFLIEKVREKKVPVVFHMEMSNEKMADTICEETNTKKLMFYSCHNVTAKQFEQGVTYIDLMQHNLKALQIALN